MNRLLSCLPPVLLAANAVLILHSIHLHSVSFDEAGHIASGVMNWQTETFSAYRVNPPTTRMLAVLPLLAAEPKRLGDHWLFARDAGDRVEWKIGMQFAEENRQRYPELVQRARYIGILWSLLGGWVLYSWCRQLYGDRGACLALGIWCFEPNLMAHAQLATPDFPCAVAALLAAYALWLYLRSPSFFRAWIAGLALGLALVTKFTLLVFLPVWLILVAMIRYPETIRPSVALRSVHAALALAVTLFVINLAYGFDGAGTKLGNIPFVSRSFGGESNLTELAKARNRFVGTWMENLPVPVPADYLRGIDVQRRDFEVMHENRWSYLAGEWKEYGWWYYYLYALAVKIPAGFLLLFTMAIVVAVMRHSGSASWRDELVVAFPGVAILVLVSSQTGFNHHGRYVLALIPFLILGTGKLDYFLRKDRWKRGTLVLLVAVWGIVGALRVYPHSFSYFNEFAGGPENGCAHLNDSNIDWGQDLLFLKNWMDEHPEASPMRALYLTSIDPTIYGLPKMASPPVGPGYAPTGICGPRPGWYVVSVNTLLVKPIPNKGHPFQYFEKFRPTAHIGYSMLVYHITEDDIRNQEQWTRKDKKEGRESFRNDTRPIRFLTDPFVSYDAVDRKTSNTDKNGNVINFSYDLLNRETGEKWIGALSNTLTFTYDPNNNMLTASFPGSGLMGTAQTNTMAYDALDRSRQFYVTSDM